MRSTWGLETEDDDDGFDEDDDQDYEDDEEGDDEDEEPEEGTWQVHGPGPFA